MKLKKFNRNSMGSRGIGQPSLGISKLGVVRLNIKAGELLGVADKDRINILQDEERPADWYVEKTADADGLVMRKCSGGGLICNSVVITKQMMDSLRIDRAVTMRLAPNPIEDGSAIYAILTSTARK